jgi:tetratricopeptide (TPR) repeat protein
MASTRKGARGRSMRSEVGNRPLAGARIAIAGRFESLTRSEVRALVTAAGGIPLARLTPRTTHLVVGHWHWPLATAPQLLKRVREVQRLRDREHPLIVFSEESFARLLDPDHAPQLRLPPLSERFPREGLSRRLWQRSLQQLRARFPASAGRMLNSLRRQGRRLVARMADGRLIEPHGQLLLEFHVDGEQAVVLPWRQAARDRLDEAVTLEEEGRFNEAVALYREILADKPDDAHAWFNLGNALYALDHLSESKSAYERSLAAEPNDSAVWNNLGVVLADLGLLARARQCWRRALCLEPENLLAAENLGVR